MSNDKLARLTNPLVTSQQLIKFQDRITPEERSIHFAQGLLTQSAGILLRLPQEVIATALVLLQRYRITTSGKSSNFNAATISSAAIYNTAKLSFTPVSPRSVINVYAYLMAEEASPLSFVKTKTSQREDNGTVDPMVYYVSEGSYERKKLQLFAAETEFLFSVGFDTHVCLPHQLSLTYLQTLGCSTPRLASRVFEHLNGALLSPQMLYLTHQPNALAVAAVYLAAREVGVKLVEENWWEVFDVEREDLGFLVLGMGSLGGFAIEQREKWEHEVVRLS